MKNEDMNLPMNSRKKVSQLHCQVEYTSTHSNTKKAKWVQDITLAEAPDVDDIDQVECLQGVHPILRGTTNSVDKKYHLVRYSPV